MKHPHPSQSIRLIACPHLALEHGRIDRYVPVGATVAEHLRSLGWPLDNLHARVFIDGQLIEQAAWEYAVPNTGQSLVARVIPMGGDEGGKTALRIVGMLAVVAQEPAEQEGAGTLAEVALVSEAEAGCPGARILKAYEV